MIDSKSNIERLKNLALQGDRDAFRLLHLALQMQVSAAAFARRPLREDVASLLVDMHGKLSVVVPDETEAVVGKKEDKKTQKLLKSVLLDVICFRAPSNRSMQRVYAVRIYDLVTLFLSSLGEPDKAKQRNDDKPESRLVTVLERIGAIENLSFPRVKAIYLAERRRRIKST